MRCNDVPDRHRICGLVTEAFRLLDDAQRTRTKEPTLESQYVDSNMATGSEATVTPPADNASAGVVDAQPTMKPEDKRYDRAYWI